MSVSKNHDLAVIADMLLQIGCIKFGQFTLKSGVQSPIYIDLRHLISYPFFIEMVCRAYLSVIKKLKFDKMAAIPYTALPITSIISILGKYPMIYTRKEVKDYGTKSEIEGLFNKNNVIVIIDDIATTGLSKLEVIDKLKRFDLIVNDVVVLIDREMGAKEILEKNGINLYSLFTINDLLEYWYEKKSIDYNTFISTKKYLKNFKNNHLFLV